MCGGPWANSVYDVNIAGVDHQHRQKRSTSAIRNLKPESFLLSSIEYSALNDKILENELASTICLQLQSNSNLTSLLEQLNLRDNNFKEEFFSYGEFKIHKSTTIKSPKLLEFLISHVFEAIEENEMFLSERIRESLGTFWNVFVNPVGLDKQIITPFRANSFLNMQCKSEATISLYSTLHTVSVFMLLNELGVCKALNLANYNFFYITLKTLIFS